MANSSNSRQKVPFISLNQEAHKYGEEKIVRGGMKKDIEMTKNRDNQLNILKYSNTVYSDTDYNKLEITGNSKQSTLQQNYQIDGLTKTRSNTMSRTIIAEAKRYSSVWDQNSEFIEDFT